MTRSHLLACSTLLSTCCAAQGVVNVTNLFDSGPGSFRNAVDIAFPLDTIRFQVTGTITVMNTPISYNKDLIIEGPGEELLVLNGNDLMVPLRITGGSTWLSGLSIIRGLEQQGNVFAGGGMGFEGDTLVMHHVRIKDCASTGTGGDPRYGGGLFASGDRIRISDCEFRDNFVLKLPTDLGIGNGGGLAINSLDFRITNSRIIGNTARGRNISTAAGAFGGGMYLNGIGMMENCIVDSNTVIGDGFMPGVGVNAGGFGGGVYMIGDIDLRNCSVSNNSIVLSCTGDPYAYGGGIYLESASLLLENCAVNANTYASNQSVWGACEGGGICAKDASLEMRDCVLGENWGRRGSGIYFDRALGSSPLNRLVLDHTLVLHGIGDLEAHAIEVWPADAVYISDSEIRGNSGRGLRVRETDTLRVERSLIMENGGGAYLSEQPTNENYFINTTFYRNGAAQGAGLLADVSTTLSLINCTFMEDTLSNGGTSGREVHLNNSTTYFKNTILSSVVLQAATAFGGNGLAAISGGGNICNDASLSGYFTQPNDLNNADPQMGTFDDHGGFTRTWSLATGSTSIDQGGADTLSMDQRGFLRDGNSDAGAYEFGAADPLQIVVSAVSSDGTVCEGQPLTVSVSATSVAVIDYQWSLNGNPISGAVDSTYSVTATLADEGSYTCTMHTEGDTVVAGPIAMAVEICTGIGGRSKPAIHVHPQPAADLLQVSCPQHVVRAAIQDMSGRMLRSVAPGAQNFTVDITALSRGMHMLELLTQEGVVSRVRFMKY